MFKRVITAGLVVIAIVGSSELAGAAPSVPNPNEPVDVDFTLPSSVVEAIYGGAPCPDFPISISALGKAKVITRGDVVMEKYPAFVVTVTNETSGESVELGATGSVVHVPQADGTVLHVMTGRNVASDPVAGFDLVAGRFTWVTDAAGNVITPQSGHGLSTDVCALIA